MSNSTEFESIYGSLAPHYRSYASTRERYIDAVDKYILSEMHGHMPRSMLDVGAGDGVRGMAIARSCGVKEIVLFDSSSEMAELCRAHHQSKVVVGRAEELPEFGTKFDLVLMLWNVLGHIEGHSERVRALTRIAESMSASSTLFLDVNNRHNGPAYGWLKVLTRVMIDAFIPDEARGDVSFSWTVDGKSIPGKGHLFTFQELKGLLNEAGLQIVDSVFVNYATGSISTCKLRGQIVLKVAKFGSKNRGPK